MAEGMDQLRAALKALGDTVVTVPVLGEMLGLQTESERQIARRRLREMIARGEVEKVGLGQFRYLPDKEPLRRGNGYIRMWKLIRVQPPGWQKTLIVSLSRMDRTTVDKYVRWLEDEGFVERSGRNGNTILWRTTAKGREQRETPWPLVDIPDPYAEERAATAALCTLLLTADPDQTSTCVKIRRHLAIMTARFCTQLENEPETQGVSDDC